MTTQMYNPSGLTSGDALRVCPYDDTHKIMAHCYQGHLVKCRKSHLGFKMVPCKFDKSHVLPEPEMKHHETKDCPSRYLMDRDLQKLAGDGHRLRGAVGGPDIVTSYMEEEVDDWDTGPVSSPRGLFTKRQCSGNNKDGYGSEFPDSPLGRDENSSDVSSELTSRVPHAPSMAAQLSAPAKSDFKPRVFEYSVNALNQHSVNKAMGATGVGRGRGFKPKPQGELPSVSNPVKKSVPVGRGICQFSGKTRKPQCARRAGVSVGAEEGQFEDSEAETGHPGHDTGDTEQLKQQILQRMKTLKLEEQRLYSDMAAIGLRPPHLDATPIAAGASSQLSQAWSMTQRSPHNVPVGRGFRSAQQ